MREIQGLARGQVLLHHRPNLDLGGVGYQELDNGTPLASLFNLEQVFAGNPAVCHGFVEGLALALAYDHVESVVFQVEGLARTLDTIADNGDNLIFQDLTCVIQGKLFTGDDMLVHSAKINSCHTV